MNALTDSKNSFENGLQFAWDGTSLELAQTCLRKYYYSMIRGISPKHKSVHLTFGGIYASALEAFYKFRANGDDYDTALLNTVHLALVESWDKEGGHPVAFDHSAKTRYNLIRTIVWYLEQYGREKDGAMSTYHLTSGKPAVELSFTLEFSDDILYCGHLDRVVNFGGGLYVMDQKTTGGTLGQWFAKSFNTSNQMSGYSLAGTTILGSPVRGVIIDAAQIAVNFTRFDRYITTRTKAQLEEWRRSSLYTIELARSATALNEFPMNLTACGNYGGCPFEPLCSRDPGVRENFIKSDYVEHNWDPLKAR